MTAIFNKIKTGFFGCKVALIAVCLVCYLVLVRLSGASLLQLLLITLCGMGYILLPGLFFSKITGLEKTMPHAKYPLAILCGTGFFAALVCVSVRLDFLWILRVVPLLFGVAGLILWLLEHQKPFEKLKEGAFITRITLWAILIFIFAWALVVKNAHPAATVNGIALNQDLLWNIGNAESFALGFPPQDIRFSLVRLSYHYLTELVWGGLAIVTGIPAYDIIAFFSGPLVLAALLCCLYALGIAFYHEHQNKALLFTASMFLFNCASLWAVYGPGTSIFANLNFVHLITNINAQSTALIFISIFLLLFIHITREHFRVSWKILLTFLCSFVLVCFAKGPAAAILLCAFVLVMLLNFLLQKPHIGKALLCLVGVAALFGVIYFAIFASGANNSMLLSRNTLEATPAYSWLAGVLGGTPLLIGAALVNTLCMQPLQFPLWIFIAVCDIKRFRKLPAERLIAHACVIGGFLAYYLFWHANSSQVYFAFLGIFFMNLLAVDAVNHIARKPIRYICTALGAIALATSIMLTTVLCGSGLRQLMRNLGISPQLQSRSFLTADHEEAAQWLRKNTASKAVFATNRIHSSTLSNDGISNVYSAISGRQGFMEGYAYAVSNMGVSKPVLREKQSVNFSIFSADTAPQDVVAFCEKADIDYLIFDRQYPDGETQFSLFEKVYENRVTAIYAVN